MNSIKFLIGVTVTTLTLTGFILLDPAFKNSLKVTYQVQEMSNTSARLNIGNTMAETENVTLNLAE